MNLLDKLAAVLHRDFLTAIRYRAGLAALLLATAGELGAFYYLARAVGPDFRPDGMAYFPFVLVGTGFFAFLMAGTHALLTAVQEAQQTGTLEVLLTTSTSPTLLVLLSSISAFGRQLLQLVLYVGVGLLLSSVPERHTSFVGMAVVFALSVCISAALGLIAASLQLAIQKGSTLLWLFGSLAWFLGGTLFPVTALPRPVQILSSLLPTTYSLRAMRLAMFQNNDSSSVLSQISALAIFAILLVPLGAFIFSWTLRRARLQGTLSFY